MDDIVPSRSSRRYWVEFLAIGNLPHGDQETALLANGCIASVGNLRIRESIPQQPSDVENRQFNIEDVANRQNNFLDYALEMGTISGGQVSLAPIYDFAPMKADPEGIVRTMRWGAPYERGGEIDWRAIVSNLPPAIDGERCFQSLRRAARKLLGLRSRLMNRGVSEQLLSIPALGMSSIDDRLARWGLL